MIPLEHQSDIRILMKLFENGGVHFPRNASEEVDSDKESNTDIRTRSGISSIVMYIAIDM